LASGRPSSLSTSNGGWFCGVLVLLHALNAISSIGNARRAGLDPDPFMKLP
jgi:hypothetical protein